MKTSMAPLADEDSGDNWRQTVGQRNEKMSRHRSDVAIIDRTFQNLPSNFPSSDPSNVRWKGGVNVQSALPSVPMFNRPLCHRFQCSIIRFAIGSAHCCVIVVSRFESHRGGKGVGWVGVYSTRLGNLVAGMGAYSIDELPVGATV